MSGAIANADPAKQQAAEALIEASEILRAIPPWWLGVTKELYARMDTAQRLIYRANALAHGMDPEPPGDWAQAVAARIEQVRLVE